LKVEKQHNGLSFCHTILAKAGKIFWGRGEGQRMESIKSVLHNFVQNAVTNILLAFENLSLFSGCIIGMNEIGIAWAC